MIAYLQGEVLETAEDSLVLLAGGVGYRVYVPLSLFAAVPAPVPEISPSVAGGSETISLFVHAASPKERQSAKERVKIKIIILRFIFFPEKFCLRKNFFACKILNIIQIYKVIIS